MPLCSLATHIEPGSDFDMLLVARGGTRFYATTQL